MRFSLLPMASLQPQGLHLTHNAASFNLVKTCQIKSIYMTSSNVHSTMYIARCLFPKKSMPRDNDAAEHTGREWHEIERRTEVVPVLISTDLHHGSRLMLYHRVSRKRSSLHGSNQYSTRASCAPLVSLYKQMYFRCPQSRTNVSRCCLGKLQGWCSRNSSCGMRIY